MSQWYWFIKRFSNRERETKCSVFENVYEYMLWIDEEKKCDLMYKELLMAYLSFDALSAARETEFMMVHRWALNEMCIL